MHKKVINETLTCFSLALAKNSLKLIRNHLKFFFRKARKKIGEVRSGKMLITIYVLTVNWYAITHEMEVTKGVDAYVHALFVALTRN
jgi:hypothetical protein